MACKRLTVIFTPGSYHNEFRHGGKIDDIVERLVVVCEPVITPLQLQTVVRLLVLVLFAVHELLIASTAFLLDELALIDITQPMFPSSTSILAEECNIMTTALAGPVFVVTMEAQDL